MKIFSKIKSTIPKKLIEKDNHNKYENQEIVVKNSIVYLDRLNRENIGARSTGKALYQIIDEMGLKVIDTFDIFIAREGNIDLSKSIDNITEQFLNSTSPKIVSLLNSIKKSKALVINGEGSMIFANPKRTELGTHMALIKIAKLFGKKTYYINSVASACTKTGVNNQTLIEVKEVIQKYCDYFCVRGPLSYEFAKKYITDNVKYIPDSLFTWIKYLDLGLTKPIIGDIVLPFPDSTFDYGKFNFSEPYILISDSSFCNDFNDETIDAYINLVNKIKQLGKKVYLIQTGGKALLEKVAQSTKVEYIPASANLLVLFSILANAELFISGRFHPSILAMLGGTPGIFMKSNCHKTLELQIMMNLNKQHEYNAIPTLKEINEIFKDAQDLLIKGDNEREYIKKKAKELSQEALKIKDYLCEIRG